MIVLETHIVPELQNPIRFVDYAIHRFPGVETRNAVKKAIKKHRFLINGEEAQTGTWLKQEDRIELLEKRERPKAYDKKIDIVYEDDYLLIANKPAGLIVSGNQFKTLENCLVDQVKKTSEADALDWALPVHRLDASTSGLVIFAKTMKARRKLGEMLETKMITKQYHAIVHGAPKSQDITNGIQGKTAESKLKVVRSVESLQNEHLSLVQLEPITGRTHQLRIHCQYIGHAIVGDSKYTNPNGTFRNKGLFLAATDLYFDHPITEEQIEARIPIPNKFNALLEREARRTKRYFSK